MFPTERADRFPEAPVIAGSVLMIKIKETPVFLQTGQMTCFDETGRDIDCRGSGQDGAFRTGAPWPEPRFEAGDGIALDRLTGLIWALDANLADSLLFWQEALDFVARMNRERKLGFSDWRLPNRRELRSLVSHQSRKPALPAEHPFRGVVESWYWSSTSAAISPAHAWYVHMAGARMFYGRKDESYLVWPVRGAGYGLLPATGQTRCFDVAGREIPSGSGQDGALRIGRAWPAPRFVGAGDEVLDWLTGLRWKRRANLTEAPVSWAKALDVVAEMNNGARRQAPRWRLPNINELESLVDAEAHSPALPSAHPFEDVQQGYWSSTTSAFETDWAWALYLDKGAIGVGQKSGRHFHVWPVCGPSASVGENATH